MPGYKFGWCLDSQLLEYECVYPECRCGFMLGYRVEGSVDYQTIGVPVRKSKMKTAYESGKTE